LGRVTHFFDAVVVGARLPLGRKVKGVLPLGIRDRRGRRWP